MGPKAAATWRVMLLLALFSAPVGARTAAWQVAPAGSSITLSTTCGDAPCSGAFRRFDAFIVYDPSNLVDAKFDIRIEVASLAMRDPERAAALLGPAFLDAPKFPGAYLATVRFERVTDGRVAAESVLRLHGTVQPVTLHVAFTPTGNGVATLDFDARLRRSDFGIGGDKSTGATAGGDITLRGHLLLRVR